MWFFQLNVFFYIIKFNIIEKLKQKDAGKKDAGQKHAGQKDAGQKNVFGYGSGSIMNNKTIGSMASLLDNAAYVIVSSTIPGAFRDIKVDGKHIRIHGNYDASKGYLYNTAKIFLKSALKYNDFVGEVGSVDYQYRYGSSTNLTMRGHSVVEKLEGKKKIVTRKLESFNGKFISGLECKTHYSVDFHNYFENDASFCIQLDSENSLDTMGYQGAPVLDESGKLIGMIDTKLSGNPHVVHATAYSSYFLYKREPEKKMFSGICSRPYLIIDEREQYV